MKKIFLSYVSSDPNISKEYLREAKEYLSKYGSVYIDIFDNKSLNWQKKIFDNICRCDLLIVLVPSNGIKSKWVKTEVELAQLANRKIQYIPSDKLFSTSLYLKNK